MRHPEARCSFVPDAQIMPFSQGAFGCYNAEGKLVKESLCVRERCLLFRVAPLLPVTATLSDSMIFGGFLFKHYGHFLLESLSRLWFAKEHPDLPIIWVGRDPDILDFQQEIFVLLGLKNPTRYADHPVRIRRLFLPNPGFLIPHIFTPFHEQFLAVQEPSPTLPGKKIYISRRHFGGDSCLLNEEELELRLVHKGFHIYYPEKHSIREQLAYLSSAEKILALEGSALHTLILLTSLKAQILIMPRPETQINPNFWTIAQRKGFVQSVLPMAKLYRKAVRLKHGHALFAGELDLDYLLTLLEIDDWSPHALYGEIFNRYPGFHFSDVYASQSSI
ncbi:MAG: glycosyltransferase family 61 protein [Desulfovibrio sp.]|nr:glycosyltransferase family 61 protein [Desulfovibrio sp.]